MILYTDGACKTSDKTGGWAFVVIKNNNKIYSEFNSIDDTTNNRMEIYSVIKATDWLINNNITQPVTIISDSMYVIGTIMQGWKRNKNHDLWELLDNNVKKLDVKLEHTKGHSGDKWNELCDSLAVAASNYNK